MNAMRGLGQLNRMRGNVVEDLYFQIEEAMNAQDIRAFARMGAYDALLVGVGTVWDHYYGGLELAHGIGDVDAPRRHVRRDGEVHLVELLALRAFGPARLPEELAVIADGPY